MGKVPRIVVMGVSGAGKTCIAGALARRLASEYADGDAFHSPENRAKMAAGKPLEDADRWPWLEAIGDYLAQRAAHGAVVSCSALRRRYRDVLRRAAPDLVFVHLDGDPRLIERRLAARRGHFMPPSLLASQISTLEPLQPDERGIAVDIAPTPDEIVDGIVQRLFGTNAPNLGAAHA
jgi:gluconokinase